MLRRYRLVAQCATFPHDADSPGFCGTGQPVRCYLSVVGTTDRAMRFDYLVRYVVGLPGGGCKLPVLVVPRKQIRKRPDDPLPNADVQSFVKIRIYLGLHRLAAVHLVAIGALGHAVPEPGFHLGADLLVAVDSIEPLHHVIKNQVADQLLGALDIREHPAN